MQIKAILDNKYKTLPFFSLEEAQKFSTQSNVDAVIYKIKPEFTDIEAVLREIDAFLVVEQKPNRSYAFDTDGGFHISEDIIQKTLTEV